MNQASKAHKPKLHTRMPKEVYSANTRESVFAKRTLRRRGIETGRDHVTVLHVTSLFVAQPPAVAAQPRVEPSNA